MAMKRNKPSPQKRKPTKAALRPFTVVRGGEASICDDEGKMCYNGDTGMFAKKRAEELASLGLLKVEFNFDEQSGKAGEAAKAYKEEAVSEPAADAAGKEPSGGTGETAEDVSDGEDQPKPRRKRNL